MPGNKAKQTRSSVDGLTSSALGALAVLLAASSTASLADPTPTPNTEQRHFINDCAVMSQAVLVFAKARDQGMAKMDAFTYVTRGQTKYDPGSQVDQTLQWAFDHEDEDPTTAAAHFHGHCTLDAWEVLTPIAEQELTTAVQACEHDHAGKPDQIRSCIDTKATAMVASANALNNTPEATDVAVAPPPEPQRPLSTMAPPQPKAVAPVGAPSPAEVEPAPEPTRLALASPPATQEQKLAIASVPAATPVAPVPAPELTPEPTNVALPQPAEVQVPTVAMATAPAGTSIAPVPAPQFTPEATELALAPPPEVQVPTVAMSTVPASNAVTPVPAPQFTPEPTEVALAPPPEVQVPTVAAIAVPTETPIAPVPAPQFTPEPTEVAVAPPPVLPLPAAVPAAVASAPVPVQQVAAVAPPPASAPTPASSATVPQLAVSSSMPASLAGIGKLSIGMSMDDAAKAMHSYGQDDTDQYGNPARTFLISDGHGYIELTTEAGKPDVVYGIEYHGGADAKVAPILGVHLGDGAAQVLTQVGQPTNRSQVLDERTLWSYAGRNYSFELSSGGDLITIRIAGYDGLPLTADGTQTASLP